MNNRTLLSEIESIKTNNSFFKEESLVNTINIFLDSNRETFAGEKSYTTITLPSNYQLRNCCKVTIELETQEYLHFYNNLDIIIQVLDGLNKSLQRKVFFWLRANHKTAIEKYAAEQRSYISTTKKNIIKCLIDIDFGKIVNLLTGFITTQKRLLAVSLFNILR